MAQILLHIGFAKAGSTYLQKWFEKHPQMYFQPKHVAGGFYDAWRMASYAEKHDAPENYVFSCEDLSLWQGELEIYGLRGNKPYNYRKFAVTISNMLHNLYPNAKVLIVCRGYKTIFHSIYAQYLSMAGTLNCASIMTNHKQMFSEMLDYNYIIPLYRERYGTENVLVLPYELLRDEPERFTAMIEDYAGVKDHFKAPASKVNASYSPKVLSAYYNVSRLVYALLKPFPKKAQTNIYRWYMDKVRFKKPHPFLKFLSPLMSDMTFDGADEMATAMKGKAEILRNEPLFQPYLKEYFL